MTDASQPLGVLDSLQVAKSLARQLVKYAAAGSDRARLEHLEAAVATLDAPRAARAPVGIEEYVRQWHEYLEGKVEHFDRRSVRNLCWHPETATSDTFQYYLSHENPHLKSRALQGLVRSCHARWSHQFAQGTVASTVRKRLEQYDGPSRLLANWKQAEGMLLGPDGAERFGDGALKECDPIKKLCQGWCIADEFSAYVQTAVAHASDVCREQMDRVSRLREYLLAELLPWQGWAPDRFKVEVGKTILHAAAHQESTRLALIQFIRKDPRLGGPRLSFNQPNWAPIRDAERKVRAWMSQFDIVFFFEQVLPQGKDPHRRKQFWLQYVNRVTQSRPLLSPDDRYRLETVLRAKRLEAKDFGRIEGQTSAFILDFGKVIVVEFSRAGNACYVYHESEFRKFFPDFWTDRALSVSGLKRTSSFTRQPISGWKGVHRPGWELDARQLLAQYGVRPQGEV